MFQKEDFGVALEVSIWNGVSGSSLLDARINRQTPT